MPDSDPWRETVQEDRIDGRADAGLDGQEELADSGGGGATSLWFERPLSAWGLLALGVLLAAIGVWGFLSASADRLAEEDALVAAAQSGDEITALGAEAEAARTRAADLAADAALLDQDASSATSEAADARDRAGVLNVNAGAVEADLAAGEDAVRELQSGAWGVYGAVAETIRLDRRIDVEFEVAVRAGNVRLVDAMKQEIVDLQEGSLADLEGAAADLDRALDRMQVTLANASTTFEITEGFEGELVGWEPGWATNGTAEATDGGYAVSASEETVFMWGLSPYDIADVTVQVDATPQAGPEDGVFAYGVICRGEVDAHFSGYWFAVGGDGYFQVGRFGPPDFEFVDLLDAGTNQFTPAIERGLQTNRIGVTCDGADLSFSINGMIVWEGTDDLLTSGSIGLWAITYSDDPVAVRFDDLVLTDTGRGSP